MKRRLKNWLKLLLPVPLRAGLRTRWQRWLEKKPRGLPLAEIDLEPDPASGGLRCRVGALSFLAPADCEGDLRTFATSHDGPAELAGIARWAKSGADGESVLFDIGAHGGIISSLFCAASPRHRTFCFEPSPLLQERLRSIREINGLGARMTLEPVAIGAAPGKIEMLVDPVGGFVQCAHFEHSMWGRPEAIVVPVETLEDASRRLGVVPDFVKIDVEGYEHEVVQGSLAFLARHRPVLFFELHLDYLEQRRLSPKSVVRALESCGYRFEDDGGAALPASALYDSVLPGLRFVARPAQ